MTPRIAVVIPAYNASGTVAAVVAGIPAVVSDIVVVDDASTVPLEALADPRVVLVRLDQNRGVGGATLAGYDAAIARGAQVLVKMDADGQMDPRHLPALVRPILAHTADYTKGNRFLHAAELRTMPGGRRVGNAGLSFLTKLASGYWPVFDPTNGYSLTISPACMGSPASITYRVQLTYDTSPGAAKPPLSFDVAPDQGLAGPVPIFVH